MVVVVAASVVGLLAVLVALYAERPSSPQPAVPAWGLLPTPADLGRLEFPTALTGYDPASVEAAFETVRQAYEDLHQSATPEVLARARARAALRAGLDASPLAVAGVPAPPHAQVPPPPLVVGDDREALRAEVALAAVLDRSDR